MCEMSLLMRALGLLESNNDTMRLGYERRAVPHWDLVPGFEDGIRPPKLAGAGGTRTAQDASAF